MWGFIGWFAGTALRFLWPYLRKGMQIVAEENDIRKFPAPEWKYLMMFIISAAELGLALLLFQGFYQTVVGWELSTAALAGYAATAIGKDGLDAINAVVTWRRK